MKRSATSTALPLRPESSETEAGVSPLWPTAAIALLGARWLLPCEAPEQGRTLWIACAWLLLGAAWCWRCWRLGNAASRWDRWDALICALCGGHVLSSIHVLIEGGQRRAALTMLWEWLALGAALLLCRRWFCERASRQSLLAVLVALVVSLSVLGVWQHHVWYANLGEALTEYEALSSSASLNPEELERLDQLRAELGPDVALLGSTGGYAFRSRILDSTEPVGRFALANSFAALVLFGTLLLTACCVHVFRTRQKAIRMAPLVAMLLLVAYVLLLTHSRSAILGLMAAAVAAGGCFVARGVRRRSLRVAVVGGGIACGLLIAVTWIAGGLDRVAFSEAAKSLRYRGEFWQATWRVIQDVPWLGTGPGNFRQAYLAYKLPGSSEEILDPHNLFLEVWAIGGIIPLIALIAIVAGAIWATALKRNEAFTEQSPDRQALVWGALLAGGLPLLVKGVLSPSWDSQLLAVTCGALIVAMLFSWWSRYSMLLALDHPVILFAAIVGLVVHLSASGGIGMPGISQILLLLCLFGVTPPPARSTNAVPAPEKVHLIGIVVMLGAFAGAVLTGLLPASLATTYVYAGDIEVVQNRSPAKAMELFTLACEADPLDPIPWSRRGSLTFTRWETASASDRNDLLEEATGFQLEAIERDLRNPKLKFELGSIYWRAFRRDEDVGHLTSALEWLHPAAEGYPNSSLFQGTLALALAVAGDTGEAVEHAVRAIELDDLNRAAGHYDKLLSESMLQDLDRVRETEVPSSQAD